MRKSTSAVRSAADRHGALQLDGTSLGDHRSRRIDHRVSITMNRSPHDARLS